MDRIAIDPNALQCPDYASDPFAGVRQLLIDAGLTQDQSIHQLTTIWTASNNVNKLRWQEQLNADAKVENHARIEHEDTDHERQEREEREKAQVVAEERCRNRVKYIPVPLRDIPSVPITLLSPYAENKLAKGLYVELWYYTNAGLAHASKESHSVEDEAMTMIRGPDGTHSWIPVSAAKGASAAIPDRSLTWEEFCHSSARIVTAMDKASWPKDHIDMFIKFWSSLQAHKYPFSPDSLNQKTLLTYQDEQRCLWHQNIINLKSAYSLATINEDVLRRTRDRVYIEDRHHRDNEHDYVSIQALSLHLPTHLPPPTWDIHLPCLCSLAPRRRGPLLVPT
ncbi:hypothetical protein CCMSSC00406_0004774 [Pleurotus cornucopiae]|uniref:Uncharacterized protein n=1 Tax=Pleurotus cornucopiae TaxID=5321 RepID=A0ACB7J1Y0_PLECO|nr:hypothetical protein CCMSSC00406_0004774 [Pleurotus cornucopiae]